MLKNTKTIFIGNVHLGLEKNRDSNERVLKPLNFIFILFLFPDLPIEGGFKKNQQGHKPEELVNNPCGFSTKFYNSGYSEPATH